MIRYALKCDNDHRFESWFQNASAFDALKAAGHVVCPDCGSTKVEKTLMAPKVRPARSAPATPEMAKATPAPAPSEQATPHVAPPPEV